MIIQLSALLFVVCSPSTEPYMSDCRNYLTKCINEKLKDEYYLQYKLEIRKARVFSSCIAKGGFKL